MSILAIPLALSDFPLTIISVGGNSWKYIKWSKLFIYQLMHKRNALKRIIKFTLQQLLHYFYRCTVHFEDSLIITYQQMH
jgi:hypothetical protein